MSAGNRVLLSALATAVVVGVASLVSGCGAGSQAQAQLAAITLGCDVSLKLVRGQKDPAQIKLVEDGCGASLHAWQEDGRPK